MTQPAYPTLTDQRDHFRKMEEAATDPDIKAQWKILADGLDERLADDDIPLW